MNRTLIAAVVAGCLWALTVDAADQAHTEDQDNFFKRTGKQIGHDAKIGAQEAAQAFKKLGQDIAHGTSQAVKDIGHGMKESAERTARAAKHPQTHAKDSGKDTGK